MRSSNTFSFKSVKIFLFKIPIRLFTKKNLAPKIEEERKKYIISLQTFDNSVAFQSSTMKQAKFKIFFVIFLQIIFVRVKAETPKRSLVFVCDATKSMTDDLKQLRDGADKILDKFSGLKEHPIKNYVLSLFRDQGRELRFFLGPRTGAKFNRLGRALEITNHRFFC
jgi:hypothetical protein